jgi:hypothetical protein
MTSSSEQFDLRADTIGGNDEGWTVVTAVLEVLEREESCESADVTGDLEATRARGVKAVSGGMSMG